MPRSKKKKVKQEDEEEVKDKTPDEEESEDQDDVEPVKEDKGDTEQEEEDELLGPVTEEKQEKKKPVTQSDEISQQIGSLSTMMSDLVVGMTAISRRVERMETGGANEFRYHQKPEDIARAAEGRVGVDERITKIVDTILGEDFGISLERIDDNSLGLLFTLTVPQRLSDIKEDMRPVVDPTTLVVMKDARGQDILEKYWPGDRRSRAIPTGSSFDLIREHCERVRAYIVATYQKTNRPSPEFKIKN
jgi:hypothetical protein